MSIPAHTREILARHGLQLKKSLGQNFLTNRHVLDRIVEAAHLTPTSGVIEIGPGIGALTEPLVAKAGKVVAVELDQRLLPVLRELFAYQEGFEVIHGDARKVDFQQIIDERLSGCSDVQVIANLPYYITSPILTRLLSARYPLNQIIVMVQKEVAERLLAEPSSKAYGSLTLFVRYFAIVELVLKVPRHVFVPQPNVDSAVIRLIPRQQPLVQVLDEEMLFSLIRAAFHKRRKTLLNALSDQPVIGLDKRQWHALLQHIGLDDRRRGETLTLEEFAQIAMAVSHIKSS
jgi:16S rRNA (adenine1518-N6/adenine1519-N6)-dimethyltransferase